MDIIKEYLSYNDLYKTKYENYLVFLCVGSFYECYGLKEDGDRLKEISSILNIILTKKNKTIPNINSKNPYMMGIPCVSIEKYLNILLDNNYTVIVYDQHKTIKGKFKRELTKIYSPGTNLNINQDESNNILSLNIIKIKNNYILGLSYIDISTGISNIYENYYDSELLLLDDIYKFIIQCNPKEIIINTKIDNIINFIKQHVKIVHDKFNIPEEFNNINYQNKFLEKIFKDNQLLSRLEYLDIERYLHASLSYIILLSKIYEYDNNLINNISKPIIINNKNVLNLHNNALYQLDVLPQHNNTHKYNSLYTIINKTSTPMGKRLLKNFVCEPITEIDELNKRYNAIELLKNKELYQKFEIELNKIIDIERSHIKLGLNQLLPFQYARLDQSYQAILKLIKLSNMFESYFDFTILNEFKEYYIEYTKIFNISNLETYNFLTNVNIFNNGVVDEVETIINNIESEYNNINNLIDELSTLINNDKIELKKTDRDGYYLVLTTTRAKKLQKIINENNIYKDLKFDTKTKTYTYITSININLFSKNIINLQSKLVEATKDKYYLLSNELYNKYSKSLIYISKYIANLDIYKSNTKVSILYNYSKPNIIKSDKSFVQAKDIRHPIIELILDDIQYIPNDVNTNQILMYGINSSGKSSFMKSLGLNIILAQIGCYVAASEFNYNPYNNIFTRINHSDNLFKNKSSFMIEILELKTIIDKADQYSLVLGDELLSSTENISAVSIISASINHFLNNNISFIFASHIHNIPDYIEDKTNLYICHLTCDIQDDILIFNRKLVEGVGNINYGLLVAKNLFDNNSEFIKNALQIQNNILNKKEILSTKKASYNSKLYVDICYICNDLNISQDEKQIIHVHHIKEQHTFDKCQSKQKNHKSNLVSLCAYHHQEVHKEKINIDNWIQTSDGVKLLYNIKL